MADNIATAIQKMNEDGIPSLIARNPAAQFGRTARPYLGATILPERNVTKNTYKEQNIRFRTIMAPDAARYSPVQLRGNDLYGEFLVDLGNTNIGAEMSAQEFEALQDYLDSNMSMEAMASVTKWLDTRVNIAMIENAEKQRWQAIVDSSVVRIGDNAYSETVTYENPAGHRAAAAAAWSTGSTDIFDNIHAAADVLIGKGYEVGRIITSRNVVSIMSQNDTVKTRGGVAVVDANGQITSASGRVTGDTIDALLLQDQLPPIETYDLQYRTSDGTKRFLKSDVMVLIGTTGVDEDIDLGDSEKLLTDTLGYHAVGKATGQTTNGRTIKLDFDGNLPPRVYAQGWQTHLPVITEPEAIAVITGIA